MPPPSIDLSGRRALVTGAARGIGRATAERLLGAGCAVIANIRATDPETAQGLAALGAAHPGRLVIIEGSVTEAATAERLSAAVDAGGGRLDILVNNAGILRDNLLGMIPEAEIASVIEVNLAGVLTMTRLAAGFMIPQGSGSIVNVASIIGRRGNVGQFVYGASKAGVIGATLASAKELAPHGIRVNAVAPGLIDTTMIERIPEAQRNELISRIAMGRIGRAEDVADVALFLASDLSCYVAGQVLGVDGGLVL